jgi:hypothetical protein
VLTLHCATLHPIFFSRNPHYLSFIEHPLPCLPTTAERWPEQYSPTLLPLAAGDQSATPCLSPPATRPLLRYLLPTPRRGLSLHLVPVARPHSSPPLASGSRPSARRLDSNGVIVADLNSTWSATAGKSCSMGAQWWHAPPAGLVSESERAPRTPARTTCSSGLGCTQAARDW